MKPISEMKYRVTDSGDVASDMRLVAIKGPLAEHREMRAFAALPMLLRALLDQMHQGRKDGMHTHSCVMERRGMAGTCAEDCVLAREALSACGVDVG